MPNKQIIKIKQPTKINCVKLQRDIRNKIHQEFKGLPLEEQLQILSQRVATDPMWRPFFKSK